MLPISMRNSIAWVKKMSNLNWSFLMSSRYVYYVFILESQLTHTVYHNTNVTIQYAYRGPSHNTIDI